MTCDMRHVTLLQKFTVELTHVCPKDQQTQKKIQTQTNQRQIHSHKDTDTDKFTVTDTVTTGFIAFVKNI